MKRPRASIAFALTVALTFVIDPGSAWAVSPTAPAASSEMNPEEAVETEADIPIEATPIYERVSLDSSDNQIWQGSLGITDGSSDGRLVVFANPEPLADAGDGPHSDIYVRNRLTGALTLVSVGVAGAEANGASTGPSMSANGRYVAFTSDASNLVPGDTNGRSDVFVRDITTATTRRVSVTTAGKEANGNSHSARISDNGRAVVFISGATNLVPADKGAERDIYSRDLVANATELVSVSMTGSGGNDHSLPPSVDATGRYVTFLTRATNLTSGPGGPLGVMVRDLRQPRATRLPEPTYDVPCALPGKPRRLREAVVEHSPAISANGRYLLYAVHRQTCPVDRTKGTESSTQSLIRVDRTNSTRLELANVSTGDFGSPYPEYWEWGAFEANFQLSADGRYYTYRLNEGSDYADTVHGYFEVTELVIGKVGGATKVVAGCDHRSDDDGESPPCLTQLLGAGSVLAPTGKWLLFVSGLSDLVPNDTNRSDDVFRVTFSGSPL